MPPGKISHFLAPLLQCIFCVLACGPLTLLNQKDERPHIEAATMCVCSNVDREERDNLPETEKKGLQEHIVEIRPREY